MPSLSDQTQSQLVKLLYIGDSGTGKTGSLTSLVAAGYNLRILDMDAGIDTLAKFVKRECPDKIKNVEFEQRRDKYRVTAAGPMIDGQPKAFVDAMNLMMKWTDGSNPAEWGERTFFILDSLSAFSRAAFEWAKGMNPTSKDPRQWYGQAQKAVEDTLSILSSPNFRTNVIIISHVQMQELSDGSVKGYVNAVGKAMGPVIPRYFNTLLLAESSGSGDNVRRVIRTVPTGLIDLKTSAPFKLEKSYPLGAGLATIVEKLREE